MVRRKYLVSFALCGILALAACSSLKLPFLSGSQSSGQAAGTPAAGGFDPANMSVDMKLAVGTLQLEKSDYPVTPEQAKALLPLWKAVKALSTSDTISQQEMDGLYAQIKEAMTADQMAYIEQTQMNPDDLSALMKDLGIEMPAGGAAAGRPDAQLSESERATRVARFSNGGQGNRNRGGGFAGGVPGGGMPGGAMPGGQMPGQGNTQGTPQPGQNTGSARRAMGMNTMFVEPLIKFLETRAAE